MNWLITGGCGFIGRALIARLVLDGDHHVRVVDNLSVGTVAELEAIAPVAVFEKADEGQNWQPQLSLLIGDILDREMLCSAAAGADVVVHLAANTGVLPSVEDPIMDCEVNVIGTLNALEAGRRSNTRRFIFASSGAPLGVQTPPLHEELAPHPASPYGASKLAGEGYCSAYFHAFGLPTVALRFGNVYGEGSTHKSSVVAKFIKRALIGEALEIYGDGTQTRDFIYISDLVEAITAAAAAPGIGGETFQIATARETTVEELTDQLVSILERNKISDIRVFNGASRAGEVTRNYSDTRKAREQLGWDPKVSLTEGLQRTVSFFLNEG